MVENDLFLFGPTCNSTGLKGNQMKDISWPENRENVQIFSSALFGCFISFYTKLQEFLDFFLACFVFELQGVESCRLSLDH